MATATQISGNLWLVTLDNGTKERVANTSAANTGAAALAIATAIQATPDAATVLADWRSGASCTRFQAMVALSNSGKLAAANAAVSASGNVLIQLAWAEALIFRRNSPSIAALAGALSLTATDLDTLFIAAVLITA